MKRLIRSLLAISALAPLSTSAALLISAEASHDDPGKPVIESHLEQPATVDLLNDPEPFRMNPEGIRVASFAGLTIAGDNLLYIAQRGDDDISRQRAEMVKKIEARIKELKQAGKNDQAAAISKKLAAIKMEAAKRDAQRAKPETDKHEGHDHDKQERHAKGDQAHQDRDQQRPQDRRMRPGPGRQGGGEARGQRQQLEERQKMFHMQAAIRHLRAAGANEIAERIERGLKDKMEQARKPAPTKEKACPDCGKGGKKCPKCDPKQGCPDCKKGGKSCPKCTKDKAKPAPAKDKAKPAPAKDKAKPVPAKDRACPDCGKDGKKCPKCDPKQGCPDCKKDGKSCPKCTKDKTKPAPAKGKTKPAPAKDRAKPASQSIDPARLRAHLQARDARVGNAISGLQKQVDDLRKQLAALRSKVEHAAKQPDRPKADQSMRKKAAPTKPKEDKNNSKKKKASTSKTLIEA